MTTRHIYGLAAALLMTLAGAVSAAAQVNDESLSDEEKPSALLYEFSKDFDVVFEGVQKGLIDAGYEIDIASKRKKEVSTKFKILSPGEDDFFDNMEPYGEVPYVRSPSWKDGRVSLTVRFEETGSGTVMITVSGELSGFEERFLRKWLWWTSNGVLEEAALQSIVTAVDGAEGSDL